MVDKRTVTIGVTINLGNYESLRVEVSDTAEDESAVRELVDFLGQTLDEFGMQDAVTRAAVERYKERVLDRDAPEDLESGYFPMEEVPLIHPVEGEEEEIHLDVLEDTRVILPDEAEEDKLTEMVTQTEETLPAQEGEFFCDKCGVPVSKVQRDVSNLFMGKTLCKKCMK
ncbi:hypothetical protein SDC9_29272 [bioreactor metagenome]|uniref:Uncharacterized protein n=1 Tax=bioreactor metagenome TaxID=1076179 RepID=A0A644UW48_9ZZZZ|nr:hypothetical protein [Methanocorpusculum sp.]